MLTLYDSEVAEAHPTNEHRAIAVSDRLRVSAAECVRAAILGSLGLAITSEFFVPELASGAVRTVLAEWTLPTIDL